MLANHILNKKHNTYSYLPDPNIPMSHLLQKFSRYSWNMVLLSSWENPPKKPLLLIKNILAQYIALHPSNPIQRNLSSPGPLKHSSKCRHYKSLDMGISMSTDKLFIREGMANLNPYLKYPYTTSI